MPSLAAALEPQADIVQDNLLGVPGCFCLESQSTLRLELKTRIWPCTSGGWQRVDRPTVWSRWQAAIVYDGDRWPRSFGLSMTNAARNRPGSEDFALRLAAMCRTTYNWGRTRVNIPKCSWTVQWQLKSLGTLTGAEAKTSHSSRTYTTCSQNT